MTITSTTATSGDTTNHSSLNLIFNSNEVINDFVANDIICFNGTITNFSGSGTVYTATFTPIDQGVCRINVPEGTFKDAVGNDNISSNEFIWTYDTVPPKAKITLTLYASKAKSSRSNLNNSSIKYDESLKRPYYPRLDI